MIARSQRNFEPDSWQDALRSAWTNPTELLAHLGTDPHAAGLDPDGAAGFRFLVPRPFAALITPGDPQDPLLRQVLPLAVERARVPGFGSDPVGDTASERAPGLLHKYRGRALLLVTGACAVHCRYCFRREFPYEQSVGTRRLQEALAVIAADESIEEVILSGGDPLVLEDARLASLAASLAAIPHLRRLRIHTRLPVTLPARFTPSLLAWLTGTRLAPVLVLHANHARELGPAFEQAIAPFRKAGITLLNQSVLLRGVNDEAGVLAKLSVRLHECGVLPYYLHALDRVNGAAHFDVPDREATALLEKLRALLPGYLVPKLVREVAGAAAKLPLP